VTQTPPFGVLYFDSNILLANHWPQPLPTLANTFELARWWNISACLPAPVLEEVENHWLRELHDSVTVLRSARGKVLKAARPVEVAVSDVGVDIRILHENYQEMAANAIETLGVSVVEFTRRSAEEIFGHATRYRRPFAAKSEGKGFQDAVILLSILDNLNQHPDLSAVFVTNDRDFDDVDCGVFVPGFHRDRFRVLDLDSCFDELYRPHFDETRVKPYRKLLQQADDLARSMVQNLRDFAIALLTPDMLSPLPGDRILRIESFDTFEVRFVQVPFPESNSMSNVDIAIKVMATCNVRVVTDLAFIRSVFGGISTSTDPATRESNKNLTWLGLIEASGSIVDGSLRALTPKSVARDEG
jgi:hypothetical protein